MAGHAANEDAASIWSASTAPYRSPGRTPPPAPTTPLNSRHRPAMHHHPATTPRPPAEIRARRPKAPRAAAGVDPGVPPPSTPRACRCRSAPVAPPWPTQPHGPPPRSPFPHRRQDLAALLAYRARRGPLTCLACSSGKHDVQLPQRSLAVRRLIVHVLGFIDGACAPRKQPPCCSLVDAS